MKALLLSLVLLLPISTSAYLWRGPNGVIYGNICMVQLHWIDNFGRPVSQMVSQEIQPQPVGSNCFASRYNLWGYIANF